MGDRPAPRTITDLRQVEEVEHRVATDEGVHDAEPDHRGPGRLSP